MTSSGLCCLYEEPQEIAKGNDSEFSTEIQEKLGLLEDNWEVLIDKTVSILEDRRSNWNW